jgi:hypothetical protein
MWCPETIWKLTDSSNNAGNPSISEGKKIFETFGPEQARTEFSLSILKLSQI